MSFLARFCTGFLDRLLAVVLALAAAQAPIYLDQYTQVLAGVRLEASTRYEELVREANALQLSVERFVQRHEQNADPVFQASGRIHRTTLERYRRFETSYRELTEASAWRRPVVLARQFDPQIHEALRFTPGLPLSTEGLVWALGGVLLAGLISGTLGWLFAPQRRQALGRL